MDSELSDEERLIDLLSARATDGLTAAEELELRGLLATHPEFDLGCCEAAIGDALEAVDPCSAVELPDAVRERLRVEPESQPHRARSGAIFAVILVVVLGLLAVALLS